MRQNHRDPLHGGSGSGLDDFAGSDKSGQFLPSIDSLKQAAAHQPRRQGAVERVHKLGARATFEFLDELVRCHPEITGDLDRRLAVHAERLSPALLAAAGGDRFSTAPMHAIGGGR